MLQFENFTIENLKKYSSFIKKSPFLCNDISIGSFLMWNKGINLQFAIFNDTFITKQDICGDAVFSFPYGNDVNGAIDALIEFVKRKNISLVFYGIDDNLYKNLSSYEKLTSLQGNYDRRWSDYFYDFNEMRYFSGKKFSGQRNHVNKFLKTYGIPTFSKITKQDLPRIKKMLEEYSYEHLERLNHENSELSSTIDLLENFEEFGLLGAKLEINGKIISFSIGEIIGETLIIHVEKALKSYLGVYPTTFNYFVNYVNEISEVALKYVNREDDSGDLGLRTSKLQYKPIFLVNKYLVKVNSPLLKVDVHPNLEGQEIYLDQITENDKKEYFALCTDEENNSLWGYDYKTDSSITGEINENTFFDIQNYDKSIGYSINFAIREKKGGKLLGETIVYNISYDMQCEMGCRLLKSAQGKKLGQKAYSLTLNWAENVLGVSVVGKCFKQNISSFKMITRSGLSLIDEDDNFYYFKRIKH